MVPLEGTYTEKRTTDADGKVVIPTPTTPLFSVRAMVAEERDGQHEGKSFSLAKHYTTLTVHPGDVPANCDGVAWAILQDAARCCAAFLPAGKQWSASFRLSSLGASTTGALKGTAGRVRVADASATPAPELNAQVRMLSCFRDPTALTGSAVMFAKDRKATLEAYVTVPALQLRYLIRDRRIEMVQHEADAGSQRVDVTSWKMTHDERLLPTDLVVTRFLDDRRIASITMMKRTYKEAESGWHLDRQDCSTITGPAAAARTSLRFSDIEVSEAAGR